MRFLRRICGEYPHYSPQQMYFRRSNQQRSQIIGTSHARQLLASQGYAEFLHQSFGQ